MPSEIRTRLVVLAGLAVLGVTLAGVGSALGMTSPFTNSGSSLQFVVNEENVTVSNGGQTETVVNDMSNVRAITVDETASGHFSVKTDEERPLTDTERERAKEVALNNQSVQAEIESIGEYELVVEPVQQLNLSSNQVGQYNTTITVENETDGEFTIATENTTSESQDESVTLVRKSETSYVEDRATVRIRQPSQSDRDALKYTIDVDLANGTIIDITDWDDMRENSPSVNVTEEMNDSTT